MNLTLLLEMAADAFPDRIAVSSAGESLTYAQLLAAARAAGAALREHDGDCVALLDTNGPALPVAIFGAAYAGKPYVPLNYRLTVPELEAQLARIAPARLIAAPDYAAALALPAAVDVIATGDFLAQATAAAPVAIEAPATESAVAVHLFTSGTTGQPKAALLRHENLMSYILGTVEFGAAQEDDAILVAVPPYHIAGISAVLSSTYACRRMVQLPNFEAQAWLRLCREHAVSNAFLVPTMLMRIVEHLDAAGARAQLPALRAIAYGGGKMPPAVIERAMALFPEVDFTNAYGLTETSSTIALLTPDDHRAAARSDDPGERRRLASVGRPLDSIELEIRDGEGRVLGADAVGDVFVRGAQVAGEYRGLGSLVDADGWFPTRDRGYLDADGYLFLDGRADDIIVRGGENISPGEIEGVLLEHPAVADVAVVAIASEQWGEAVVAAVVARSAAPDAAVLQDWVRARLRSSRVPERIVFREQLPYNDMGKLLRRVIRQELESAL